MVDRKVVPFDEFYYQLKLMHLFQKHPVLLRLQIFHFESFLSSPLACGAVVPFRDALDGPYRSSLIAKTFFGLTICCVNSVILSSLSIIGFCRFLFSSFVKCSLINIVCL
jgi:hypothetical protein